jgi:hypothetical protein
MPQSLLRPSRTTLEPYGRSTDTTLPPGDHARIDGREGTEQFCHEGEKRFRDAIYCGRRVLLVLTMSVCINHLTTPVRCKRRDLPQMNEISLNAMLSTTASGPRRQRVDHSDWRQGQRKPRHGRSRVVGIRGLYECVRLVPIAPSTDNATYELLQMPEVAGRQRDPLSGKPSATTFWFVRARSSLEYPHSSSSSPSHCPPMDRRERKLQRRRACGRDGHREEVPARIHGGSVLTFRLARILSDWERRYLWHCDLYHFVVIDLATALRSDRTAPRCPSHD